MPKGTTKKSGKCEHVRDLSLRLGKILNSSANEIYVFDTKTLHFVQVNQGACENLGYTMEELTKLTPLDLKPEFTPETFEFLVKPLRDGTTPVVVFETLHKRKDTTLYPVEVRLELSHAEQQPLFVAVIQDVTTRKSAENLLRDSEERYRRLVELSPDVIAVHSEGKIVYINPVGARLFGARKPGDLLGKPVLSLVHPDFHETVKDRVQQMQHGKAVGLTEEKFIRLDGRIIDVEVAATPVIFQGKPAVQVFVRDIGQRKRTEAALREAKDRLEQLYTVIPSALFTVDKDSRVTSFNKKAEELTGYSAEETIGNKCTLFALHPCAKSCGLNSPHVVKPFMGRECTIKRKDGEVRAISKNADLLRDVDGQVMGGVESFEDITERKKAEEMLNSMAYYDSLTGLSNRILFNDRLGLALAQARRTKEMLAVLYIDLDNFKAINDTLGHAVGDRLLQLVGRRLKDCLRDGDTIARLGGDEFVVLLPQIRCAEDATVVATKLLESFGLPFDLDNNELFITTSIGISLYPYDGDDTETMLKNADTALYRAKEHGKNNYQLYTSAMNAKAFERLALENSMRRALDREEFVVYYQPQVNLTTGQIVGMEALLRWQHPDLGLVYPSEFIGLAEETGLIISIGDFALRTACKQNKAWQDAGHPPIRMAVNLSAKQFYQQNLDDTIAQALDDTNLHPKFLELEITESVVMKDTTSVSASLYKLKDMGIQVTIDDFGTGYSSLSYLKRFPIDGLKIDRVFIRNLTTDPNDAAIAKAIIAMAKSLNLRVVAEGVETTDQLEFLRSLKCDEIQGYLISRPVPADEATALLVESKQRCA